MLLGSIRNSSTLLYTDHNWKTKHWFRPVIHLPEQFLLYVCAKYISYFARYTNKKKLLRYKIDLVGFSHMSVGKNHFLNVK